MFDLGWWEMAVVALVALVVIGPKDLPRVLRTAGKWIGKARAIAREFRVSLDDMVRESELDEVKKSVESATSYNAKKDLENTIDPTGDMARDLDPTASGPDAASGPETPSTSPPAAEQALKEAEPKAADGGDAEPPAGETDRDENKPPAKASA